MTFLAAQYGINNAHRIILYAGTFEPYQGLDLLVDASPEVINICKNVRFLCRGGNQNQIARRSELARISWCGGVLILPGTIPPENVEQHFKIASVLVSPRIFRDKYSAEDLLLPSLWSPDRCDKDPFPYTSINGQGCVAGGTAT